MTSPGNNHEKETGHRFSHLGSNEHLPQLPPTKVKPIPNTDIHHDASHNKHLHHDQSAKYKNKVKNVPTIQCDENNLENIPVNLSSIVEALILHNDEVGTKHSVMSVDWSLFSNLTILDLSYNRIYNLIGLNLQSEQLIYLSLEHNLLDYVPNRTFAGVTHLISLSLAHNTIEMLHRKSLWDVRHLTFLDLSHNRLFELDPEWFFNLQELHNLNMRYNNIHKIQGMAFSQMIQLQVLDLSNNQIKTIHRQAFQGLKRLHR